MVYNTNWCTVDYTYLNKKQKCAQDKINHTILVNVYILIEQCENAGMII